MLYRKHIHHRTAKNYQLDLFDPDDGYFEYSAIFTNKEVTSTTLWFFICGSGTQEKVYGEPKGDFSFASVPMQRYEAKSAWQEFNVIAFNLMRSVGPTIENHGRSDRFQPSGLCTIDLSFAPACRSSRMAAKYSMSATVRLFGRDSRPSRALCGLKFLVR